MAALTVMDVGARWGGHPRWAGMPVVTYGLEPDAEECKRVNGKGGMKCLPYAAGEFDNAQATLYFTSGIGCSSLREPNQAVLAPYKHRQYFEVVKTVPITTTTLDTICAVEGVSPDVLKLDIQGTELEALRGAQAVLNGVLAVELEVSFQELYTGQALFAEVDTWLRARGFTLVKLRTESWRRKCDKSPHGATLMYGDALYLHEPRLEAWPAKAAMIYRAYKLHDRSGERAKQTWYQRLWGWVIRHTNRRDQDVAYLAGRGSVYRDRRSERPGSLADLPLPALAPVRILAPRNNGPSVLSGAL